MRSRLLAFLLLFSLLAISCATPAAPPTTTSAPPTAAPPKAPGSAAAAASPTIAPTPSSAGAPTPAPAAATKPAAPAATATPASATKAPAASAFPVTITDDAGRKVTIDKAPERIVSIAPSNTEIVYALGLGDKVVGVDKFSNYPPEAKQKTQLGSYTKPDLELLVAASPDLVLATSAHVKTVVPDLEARKLTVVVISPKNLDEVFDRIGLVGKIAGKEEQAAEVVQGLRKRTDAVKAKLDGAPPRRIYFELSPQLHTAGPGSFIDDLIQRAGGQNVAADATTQWPQLNQEALIQKDPEVIVLGHGIPDETPEKVKARSGWQQVSAVKQGRIATVDPDITNRPGPRVVDGLEAMARAIHPERFQ